VIVYNLRCRNSHEFEGWFRDSAAFDAQSKGGKLLCPVCDTRKVEKAIMAPSVSGAKKSARLTQDSTADEAKKMRQFMTGLRKYVQDNADYVGPKFPEEARKMHYGEVDHRSIYGEASPQEAKEMHEEGIEFHPLPMLPDERN